MAEAEAGGGADEKAGAHRPSVYNIPAHRAFADALAAGLIARFGQEATGDPLSLARGAILVPNNRAARSIRDAFVRRAGGGLLLPRLVPLGDPDLGERLGAALDPVGEDGDIPPACPPMERQMILARLVQSARRSAGQPVDAGEAMRLGQALGEALDQMHVEQVPPQAIRALEIVGDLSAHWQKSLALFEILLDAWPRELAARGQIDLADRRNRLFVQVSARWTKTPPGGFVVAVGGVSTVAPAVAQLLRTVSRMERGMVVLADLDQQMSVEEWDAIGPFPPDPITGRRRRAHETHPQFAMKLLLDRMGVARDEVPVWRWGGGHDARAARSRNISNAMLVPALTGKWRDLETADRSLAGVAALEVATPGEEAQAIAIALREVLETPERTAALVTPDRALATRVTAHLARWGIAADDSAGQPLSQLPPGTLLTALATAVAEHFAPVALLTLLKHPLVRRGEGRQPWLEEVRRLDLLLRGPRPAAGLEGIDALLAPVTDGRDRLHGERAAARAWWADVRAVLAPLAAAPEALGGMTAALREAAGQLSGDAVWAGHQGHAAAALFAEIEGAAHEGPREHVRASFPALMERMLEGVAVRPPQGGHPRIAIYGLIEARMQQADLMILAGLNEGSWPSLPTPDPWLAPRIRQELGLPSLERRIGLAAHDFASALGAPRVLITRARREAAGPAVASRFWLRLKAMSGPQWARRETDAGPLLAWTRGLDHAAEIRPASRPAPVPAGPLRPREVAVTDVDRLRADPYAFYARKVLGLSRLDAVDADPSAAWRGTAVHRILQLWAQEDDCNPDRLAFRAEQLLAQAEAHPLMRTLWKPRLMQAIEWIAERTRADRLENRHIALVEKEGRAAVAGVTLKGTADRIDRLADGSVAIVDYKSGKPPSARMVKAGFSLQLGLLGMIAERGGFSTLGDSARAAAFEYWSLGRNKQDGFGYRESPVDPEGKRGKIVTDRFTGFAAEHFAEAADMWLTGSAPFTATVNPDLPRYTDYDQLMRLEEWYGRGSGSNG
jgi:ATP-dependent helicase/nuclease subunit B